MSVLESFLLIRLWVSILVSQTSRNKGVDDNLRRLTMFHEQKESNRCLSNERIKKCIKKEVSVSSDALFYSVFLSDWSMNEYPRKKVIWFPEGKDLSQPFKIQRSIRGRFLPFLTILEGNFWQEKRSFVVSEACLCVMMLRCHSTTFRGSITNGRQEESWEECDFSFLSSVHFFSFVYYFYCTWEDRLQHRMPLSLLLLSRWLFSSAFFLQRLPLFDVEK